MTSLGKKMGEKEARKSVRRSDEDSSREGMGEWGEKVERVWEFLRESMGSGTGTGMGAGVNGNESHVEARENREESVVKMEIET